ncbi:MAG: RES family NAD+ phosphorylase [Mucilaginibacter sp.]
MLVYRIIAAKYSARLIASGRAARWNPNDIEVIYTASSRSLACLENVVHRNQVGLSQLFDILTIECPDQLEITYVHLHQLPGNWADFYQMSFTQSIGEKWVRENTSAVLQVPSSIVNEEVNYLLNPKHKDFAQIKIIKTQPFVFDGRIKR